MLILIMLHSSIVLSQSLNYPPYSDYLKANSNNASVAMLKSDSFIVANPPEHHCSQYNKDIILIRTSERVVGINEPLTAQIQMQIQPNPSVGNSQIILNTQGYILQNAAITIHDISGKKVLELTLENSLQASYKTVPLNTDKLIAGVYFVTINGKISQNPFSKTIKFIKQ